MYLRNCWLREFGITLDWISIFLAIKRVQFSQRIIPQFLKVGIPKGRSTSKFLAMVKTFQHRRGYSAIWAPKVGDVNATIRNKRVATRTGISDCAVSNLLRAETGFLIKKVLEPASR